MSAGTPGQSAPRPDNLNVAFRFFVCHEDMQNGCDVHEDFFPKKFDAIKEAMRRNEVSQGGRSDWYVWDQLRNKPSWRDPISPADAAALAGGSK